MTRKYRPKASPHPLPYRFVTLSELDASLARARDTIEKSKELIETSRKNVQRIRDSQQRRKKVG